MSERCCRKTIHDIKKAKGGTPLVVLTAYTTPMARLLYPYVDILLVGDSVGMVLYGMESTLPVTRAMMIAHGQAVVRGSERALVVVDMSFGTYQESPEKAFRNAARILQKTGATAVKLEGGAEMAETVAFLAARGIPVMGHIGLQPQSVHGVGGYRVQGRVKSDKARILNDAKKLEAAGAFALVIECTVAPLAEEITKILSIPTIGIGASAACDGQVLVSEDMLGLTAGPLPKFVKKYADLSSVIDESVRSFSEDVAQRQFPDQNFIYSE